MAQITVLIDEPKPYYSYLDERFFYGWLNEIDAVIAVSREGSRLELTLSNPIDDASFRDLISLLMRYEIDMKSLVSLTTKGNKVWVENPMAYWHQAMFT